MITCIPKTGPAVTVTDEAVNQPVTPRPLSSEMTHHASKAQDLGAASGGDGAGCQWQLGHGVKLALLESQHVKQRQVQAETDHGARDAQELEVGAGAFRENDAPARRSTDVS